MELSIGNACDRISIFGDEKENSKTGFHPFHDFADVYTHPSFLFLKWENADAEYWKRGWETREIQEKLELCKKTHPSSPFVLFLYGFVLHSLFSFKLPPKLLYFPVFLMCIYVSPNIYGGSEHQHPIHLGIVGKSWTSNDLNCSEVSILHRFNAGRHGNCM